MPWIVKRVVMPAFVAASCHAFARPPGVRKVPVRDGNTPGGVTTRMNNSGASCVRADVLPVALHPTRPGLEEMIARSSRHAAGELNRLGRSWRISHPNRLGREARTPHGARPVPRS